jgi:hypothetical protein
MASDWDGFKNMPAVRLADMPPLRGLQFFRNGFYRDVAPAGGFEFARSYVRGYGGMGNLKFEISNLKFAEGGARQKFCSVLASAAV